MMTAAIFKHVFKLARSLFFNFIVVPVVALE